MLKIILGTRVFLSVVYEQPRFRMLVDNPPFDKNRDHRNDTHALVERLWKLMK